MRFIEPAELGQQQSAAGIVGTECIGGKIAFITGAA
jgi:hypothetical protein